MLLGCAVLWDAPSQNPFFISCPVENYSHQRENNQEKPGVERHLQPQNQQRITRINWMADELIDTPIYQLVFDRSL